ncbi:MAG TPA: hypothetical protein VHV76_13155, partial [Mycobacteriales bacterium]|nr:hypothetical protein [Mycobacteriales bacterium]
MKRTTKALARLGTLAVLAGTVLGTPLAIGTANAAVGTITVTDGTVGSVEAAAADDNYNHDGQISIGNPDGDALRVQIGGTAYFEHNQPGGTFENSPTTATCSTTDDPCVVNVGDPAAETASFTVVDPSDATSAQSKISFNGLFFTNCPGTGIDTGEPGGTTYGNHNEPVAQNCVTQGQFGAGSQVVLTVHYGASDPLSTTNQNQGLNITLHHIGGDHSQISATQPSSLTQKTGNDTATCTTDASGNCQIAVVNSGPSTITNTSTERSYLEVDTNSSTGNFPHITSYPPAPTERIRWGAGSVVPTRFNLIDSKVLGPDSQNNASQQPDAEPGDAIQLTYEISGGCTPDSGFETCAGTTLAGISATLTTDHGFFTPNCLSGGVMEYAGCSFTTAPANGVVVGN